MVSHLAPTTGYFLRQFPDFFFNTLEMKSRLAGLLLFWFAAMSPLAVQRQGQPKVDVEDLEQRIVASVNVERKNKVEDPVLPDPQLMKIARAHSEDMAKRNFFDHKNPEGQDATARAKAAGYICRKDYGRYFTEGVAENIYQGNLYSSVRTRGTRTTYDWNTAADIAAQAIKGWMASGGHRENILDKRHTLTGVGIAIAKDDKVYITQVFC